MTLFFRNTRTVRMQLLTDFAELESLEEEEKFLRENSLHRDEVRELALEYLEVNGLGHPKLPEEALA